MKFIHRGVMPLILLSLLASNLFAQAQVSKEKQIKAQERRKFQMAQRYQRSDLHENAILLLKQLYTRHPGNVQYYQSLLESLISLSRVDEALLLIETQKATDPLNPRYEIDRASVLYKSGKEKEAKKIWKEILDTHSEDVSVFTLVANAMLTHGLFEEAIKVYKKGYKLHPDRSYFLQNIASMYRNRLQYSEALKYYLKYLKKDPKRANSVTRQVLSFRLEPEQADTLMQQLKKEAKKYRDVPEVQVLVARFYQKYEKYENAFEIYLKLENNKTQGRYLLEFGRAMQADSAYQLALRAYQEVIERFPDSPNILFAYLGAAKSNLELAQALNEQKYAQQAIVMINKMRQKYPKHPDIAELSLVEGLVYKKFFFDIDRAIRIFKSVIKQYPENKKNVDNAYLFLGESYIIRGDLQEAVNSLKKVQLEANKPQAVFYLAKIEFYRGDYAACKNYANMVIQLQGVAGAITNDALELNLLLNYSDSYPEALQYYAQADWLLFQEKKSQAVSKLELALQQKAPNDFRAKMLLLAARVSADIGKTDEALSFCNTFLKDTGLKIYADGALFLMGEILEQKSGDLNAAYKVYDRLLVEYPNSQYSHEVRSRLKYIRENLQEAVP